MNNANTLKQQLAEQYKPLTIETRVEDFDLPTQVVLGGKLVQVPRLFLNKDIHWMIDSNSKLKKAAWISKILAHILNSYRLVDKENKIREVGRAIKACDSKISLLIKNGVLRDKQGPGAMSFCQSSENVPTDSIVISERTFNQLCSHNYRWKNCKEVIVIRFPNLGPGTTCKLKLIVNKKWIPEQTDSEYSIGNRAPNLKELLDLLQEEDSSEGHVEDSGIMDAFYLHPSILKDSMQGDGDGRQNCRFEE